MTRRTRLLASFALSAAVALAAFAIVEDPAQRLIVLALVLIPFVIVARRG